MHDWMEAVSGLEGCLRRTDPHPAQQARRYCPNTDAISGYVRMVLILGWRASVSLVSQSGLLPASWPSSSASSTGSQVQVDEGQPLAHKQSEHAEHLLTNAADISVNLIPRIKQLPNLEKFSTVSTQPSCHIATLTDIDAVADLENDTSRVSARGEEHCLMGGVPNMQNGNASMAGGLFKRSRCTTLSCRRLRTCCWPSWT